MPPVKLQKKYAYNAFWLRWRVCKGNGQIVKSFHLEKSADKFIERLDGKTLQKVTHNAAKRGIIGFWGIVSHGGTVALGVALGAILLSAIGLH